VAVQLPCKQRSIDLNWIAVTVIKLRKMRWSRYVACMREIRNAYRSVVENPERKKPPEKPRYG
jgi:hypothetical protein